ncbi:MAG TPA: PilN domain-containing protein [Longimicrobiales bacterium]|nr:PilN domain-containing protein [Longimicrobiales bacterium]
MIEINLLPGSVKKSTRRGLPKLKFGGGGGMLSKLPPMDRTIGMIVAGWVLALAIVAYLHVTTSGKLNQVEEDLVLAREDSVRLHEAQLRTDTLRAREAVISQKLQVIQEIDAGRYTYAHILDELSRTLPPYVWIVNITEAFSEGAETRVRIEGRAGNWPALSRYMEDLESSPFLHQVRLLSSARTQVDERTVYGFVIELGYQEPPPDVIQTVPLFAAQPEGEGN